MKIRICFFVILLMSGLSLFAQVAPGFNFQGVARNASGELIKNQAVTVIVGIRAGSGTGTLIWEEEHSSSTNEYGMFTLVICGNSSLRTGGTAATPGEIDWAGSSHYIDLKMNAGSGIVNLGTSQLLSVPYSMVASNFAGTVTGMEVQPESAVPAGEALFMVKREDGYPVFAVYEDGVWVYTDERDPVKGVKGGFAVGGYNAPTKGPGAEYFRVTPDSTRIYVNSFPPGKGLKGGFAVGGYNAPTKGPADEFLRVTRDSTRVYVNTVPNKGLKGGFAVGGLKQSKAGEDGSFMSLERDNYFIGQNSGAKITTGLYNSVMGYESGLNITSGESNAFLGYQAGYLNDEGSGNLFLGYQSGFINKYGNYITFLGYQAGYQSWGGTNNTFLGSFSGHNNAAGSYNTFIGDSSGYHTTYGGSNTFIGTKAGLQNINGASNVFVGNNAGITNENGGENVFIGRESGYANISGSRNVYIGTESGISDSTGWDNIFVGTQAGRSFKSGGGNVIVGYQAGYNNKQGDRNVFLGNTAGFNEMGTGKLYISNTDADSTGALIWGDFYGRALRFNGNVGIGGQPGISPLTVHSENDVAGITLQGNGNGFDYSAVYLHSNRVTKERYYTMSHTVANSYFLGYVDNGNYFPRIIIDSLGHVALNNWEMGTEVLDVNGSARFRGVLSGAGNDLLITADGTLRWSASDARLKSEFEPIEDGLEKVLKMNGYTFTWNSDKERTRDAGLVAQEVEKLYPEAVFINPNDGFYGINYSRFPALFVEAFKEQQEIIDIQKEEIDELKMRLERLEKVVLSQ